MKKIKIYCGFISTGEVSQAQQFILRELTERYRDQVELVYPATCVFRIFHDFARNEVVEEFLASDCDAVWFLDSDVVPQRHVLDLVTMHWDKWEVSGAPYPVFMQTPVSDNKQLVFTAYKQKGDKGLAACTIPYEGTEFVEGLATGCLFIKRSVFAKLEKPYFEFKYDAKTRDIKEGEDLGFCKKLGKLGIKFFTDYSMACKHIKKVCLLELNNYAIEYANRAVIAYDESIKEQVVEAVKAAYQKGLQQGRAMSAPAEKPKSALVLPGQF